MANHDNLLAFQRNCRFNPAMFARSLKLYRVGLKEVWQKLRYDLAREAVVLSCSLILLATFSYVFNDFLNEQIASLSTELRHLFASVIAAALVVATGVWLFVACQRQLTSPQSIGAMSRRLGEAPSTIEYYQLLYLGTQITLSFMLAWWLIRSFLVNWPWWQPAALSVVAVVTLAFHLNRRRRWLHLARHTNASLKPVLPETAKKRSPHQTMVTWRWQQLWTRTRASQFCLGLSALFFLLFIFVSSSKAPLAALFPLVFAIGLLAALSLLAQASEDLKFSWAERTMGVAHDAYVAAYQSLAWRLVGIAGLAVLLTLILVTLYSGKPPQQAILSSMQLTLVCATPLYLAPCLMLQIDGRRPGIQALVILMVGLFVATAIFAHILATLLLPLVKYYGDETQAGRFYRA